MNFNTDIMSAYPCMRSCRPMSLAWHWVGVWHPWHSWGDDGARRLRVECDWRHYRHRLSSCRCRGSQQVLRDDLLYPQHGLWCWRNSQRCLDVSHIQCNTEQASECLRHLWIILDDDNARHSETDSDEQMLLTVDLFLVLSLDVQIQRSLSAGKQIRNVTDNLESLHSSKHLLFFSLIIISTLIILCWDWFNLN